MLEALKLLFLAVMALSVAHFSQSAPTTNLEQSNDEGHRARSLCNTFGGCGPARSLELEPSSANEAYASSFDGQHTYWSSNRVEEKRDQVGSLIGYIGAISKSRKEETPTMEVTEETASQLMKGDGEELGEDPEQLVRGKPKQVIYFIGDKDITLNKLATLPDDFQGGPHLIEADPKDYELH